MNCRCVCHLRSDPETGSYYRECGLCAEQHLAVVIPADCRDRRCICHRQNRINCCDWCRFDPARPSLNPIPAEWPE